MKKMKILALTLVVLLCVIPFAACADSSNSSVSSETNSSSEAATDDTSGSEASVETVESSNASETSDDGEPVTLKWAVWDISSTAYYQPIIDGYEAANPNVTIEMVDLGSTDYETTLVTQLAGGADLDLVCVKNIPNYANLISQNQLVSLNDYIESDGIDTDIYGGLVEDVTVDGNVYEMLFRNDTWIVYYNKDIFDEAGVDYPSNDMTVEEFFDLAEKVTIEDENNKKYGLYLHTWRSTVNLFGILDGEHTAIDGEYEWLKPYYELTLDAQEKGVIMDYATATSTSTHYRDLFQSGDVAMINMGSWYIATHIEAVKNGDTDVANWGVVKYPHPEGVEAGTTPGAPTGIAITTNSTQPDAAWDFVKYVSGEEGAALVASTGQTTALQSDEVTSIITSLDGYPQDENSLEALDTFKAYLDVPYSEDANEIDTILSEEHKEIMTGSKSIDDGIASMDSRVQEVLNR